LLDLDPTAIVDVWDQGAAGQWKAGVQDTLRRGFQIVVSSGCYFLEFPPPWTKTWGWEDNYRCDIQNVSVANSSDLQKIIGGHASRWGESTTGDNWFDHVFPSLTGVAEKLWSAENFTLASAAGGLAGRQRAVQRALCRMKSFKLGPMNVGPENPHNGSYFPWPAGYCDFQ
jgi:hypothetical protein